MNHIRVLVAIFIASIVLVSAYGIISRINTNTVETLSPSNVYVNYAGATPNSSYEYKVSNGTPATLQVIITFNPGENMSSNLSYVYVTTPNFKVDNWTYDCGSYSLYSGSQNSTFIGSIGHRKAYSDASNIQQSTLTINIASTMIEYTGPVSVHIVFTGMPGGAVY